MCECYQASKQPASTIQWKKKKNVEKIKKKPKASNRALNLGIKTKSGIKMKYEFCVAVFASLFCFSIAQEFIQDDARSTPTAGNTANI